MSSPLLTAVQNVHLQPSSSLMTASGCRLRHSLQNTSWLLGGPAAAITGDWSLASRWMEGLLLAMVGGGRVALGLPLALMMMMMIYGRHEPGSRNETDLFAYNSASFLFGLILESLPTLMVFHVPALPPLPIYDAIFQARGLYLAILKLLGISSIILSVRINHMLCHLYCFLSCPRNS